MRKQLEKEWKDSKNFLFIGNTLTKHCALDVKKTIVSIQTLSW